MGKIFPKQKFLSEQSLATSKEENMALSLGTLEFSQAQLGDFILILWRVITVHLLWGLNPLLCGRHRLFHISQTPPNQQIMPHRSDRRGKRLFCGMSADTEGADGGGNCFLFQGKTSQATSVSRSICFWASLQYSCLCFFFKMHVFQTCPYKKFLVNNYLRSISSPT